MKDAIIQLARRALPLMNPAHRAEAVLLINYFERTANAEQDDELQGFYRNAAGAWERDMMPARDALVEALQAGDLPGLAKLRRDLPAILSRANEDPTLAGVLMRQLFRVFAASLGEEPATRTANATASLEQWRSREIFPTDFGSADLRGLSSELHLRSIFSARTTNADYLDEVGQVVDDILSGKSNMATGRWQLMKKLKQLGYDPEVGFPQDMALIPPAEKGSLQDLSSRQRIDLMLRTNVEMTRNYARVKEGNTPAALRMWPAWRLKRVASREIPRGEKRGRDGGIVADARNSWEARWQAAGESVGWEGALKDAMVARKDSPIWQALGDGAGGYQDTLGHPFGPFAFNSGFDQVAVPRSEWMDLVGQRSSLPSGGAQDARPTIESGPMQAQLAPTEKEANAALDRLSPELAARLRARWAE